MTKLNAIQWGHARIRVVGANPTSSGVKVSRAFEFEIPEDLKDGEQSAAIANALKKNGFSRTDAVVVVDRECVEMRQFEIPAVPKDELPDLVRFQAANHFTSFSDSWALDYFPVKFNLDKQATSVLACALSPQLMEQIKESLDQAGIKIKSITVRGLSSIGLTTARKSDGNLLVVQQVGDEVDVVSLQSGELLMTRTFKLPNAEHEDVNKKLRQEFQRTLAVCSNQHQQAEFKKVIVIGTKEAHQHLADHLPVESDKIEFLDVNEIAGLSPALNETISNTSDFGPAIGSLIDRSIKRKPFVDLANPRKRPKVVKKNDRTKIYGGLAIGIALACLIGAYWFLSSMEKQIEGLKKDLADLQTHNVNYDQTLGEVEEINKWKRADVDWLAVLDDLSTDLPMPDDVIIDSFQASLKPSAERSIINLEGRISNSDLDRSIEETLRHNFLVAPIATDPLTKDALFKRKIKKELTKKLDEVEIVEDDPDAESDSVSDAAESDDDKTSDASSDQK